jgi:uncharacterized protein (TIGR02594 family)
MYRKDPQKTNYQRDVAAVPPWMLVAKNELGQAEVPGAASNARIMEYLKVVGTFVGDETPWCSAFANWCMKKTGHPSLAKANARSWLQWGTSLSTPKYGAITVFWRDDLSSWKGHVAFYVRSQGNMIHVLGGNQSNQVSVKGYSKNRLLGYRWPYGGIPKHILDKLR